jgi:hypothetical protein
LLIAHERARQIVHAGADRPGEMRGVIRAQRQALALGDLTGERDHVRGDDARVHAEPAPIRARHGEPELEQACAQRGLELGNVQKAQAFGEATAGLQTETLQVIGPAGASRDVVALHERALVTRQQELEQLRHGGLVGAGIRAAQQPCVLQSSHIARVARLVAPGNDAGHVVPIQRAQLQPRGITKVDEGVIQAAPSHGGPR